MDFYVDNETLIICASGPSVYECEFAGKDYCTKVTADVNQLKAKAIMDSNGTITIVENSDLSQLYVDIRRKRNALLAASDWTQLEDSRERKDVWAKYRQELRDLPNNLTDPTQVVWPAPPS